jgi:hypothetical protein
MALFALVLTACGGSNENVSPGSVVIIEEVEVDPGDGGDGGDSGDGGGGAGPVINSVIPADLDSVIFDSGDTSSAGFGSKPIYLIDVSQLTGGKLDPTGLLLGNDFVFEIAGGALLVSPSAGVLGSDGDVKDVSLEGEGGTVNASGLPDCVLEMAPGAVVFGSSSSDFLVIEQGCALVADGTAEQPIIFTAAQDVDGVVEDNERGLWGGVVINGSAPINDCPAGIEGGTAACTKEGEANSGTFGGADPSDNSGILRYVNVRYAGSNVDEQNQLNGIAFQGVGDETVVEYVQVHNNLDDGIEFFGGTVDAKYVVLTGNADDSLDWTDGWSGRVQYLYIEQASNAGDQGIEADNREGDEDALPRSNPTIANMTVLGNPGENALRFRRGTGIALSNSYVDGSASCIRVDGTSRDLLGSNLTVAGTSFACAEAVSNDPDGAVETYLDSAVNVSLTGESVNPVPPTDNFFDVTNYIGAFGAEDWSAGWTVPGSVSSPEQPDFGCPVGTTESPRVIDSTRVCSLSGDIFEDILLTANNFYELVGKVTIGGDDVNPAVLSVQAGTTIFGGSSTDFLVISRGSQLIANGSRTAPVTFTALADLEGNADIDVDRGLWGGLVINGKAPINDCPAGIAGGTAACTKEGEANSGTFGGDQPEDSSGVLRYVVVKFAGSNVDEQNQLNGIAFQGVGAGTEVEFVQVHNNLDDGIEFFGGTVNAKYVVLTGNADDSLDWTDGWQGSVQYLLIQQADDAGDNGIEADSREGDETAEPRSLPRIANMTIKGNAAERAVYLRRGTGLETYNTIVEGSANCLRVAGDSLNQLGTGITFDGVSFGCPTVVEGDDIPAIEALLDASNVSQTGQAVPPADLSGDDFFEDVPFIGAVQDEANDWTTGWTVGMPETATDFPCPTGTTEVTAVDGRQTCEVAGTIVGDLVLTRDNYYLLNGKVTVGDDNANPGRLYIDSGTTIIGDDTADFLVVSRGSQILATGTRFSPITMTALTDVLGTASQTDRGLWGGLVINGNAPINDCPAGIDGGTAACTKEGEANSGLFGGDQPLDDSGVLNYLVVKFAGSAVDAQNELNGIAFQGVGSATEVDYIQVYNNLDDGVEFFGGTVNVKHVVLTGNADDSLDWTDGWVGSAQFVHIVQADTAGDSGIEADNREGNALATPVSEPNIANLTILGRDTERGILLRRGTGLHLYNSAVSGSDVCLLVGPDSVPLLGTGITFEGVSLGCSTIIEDGNTTVQDWLDASPNVTQDGSTPPPVSVPGGGFFEQVDVIGSDVDDWGDGWTVTP